MERLAAGGAGGETDNEGDDDPQADEENGSAHHEPAGELQEVEQADRGDVDDEYPRQPSVLAPDAGKAGRNLFLFCSVGHQSILARMKNEIYNPPHYTPLIPLIKAEHSPKIKRKTEGTRSFATNVPCSICCSDASTPLFLSTFDMRYAL
jgi:hypothetical protein